MTANLFILAALISLSIGVVFWKQRTDQQSVSIEGKIELLKTNLSMSRGLIVEAKTTIAQESIDRKKEITELHKSITKVTDLTTKQGDALSTHLSVVEARINRLEAIQALPKKSPVKKKAKKKDKKR